MRAKTSAIALLPRESKGLAISTESYLDAQSDARTRIAGPTPLFITILAVEVFTHFLA